MRNQYYICPKCLNTICITNNIDQLKQTCKSTSKPWLITRIGSGTLECSIPGMVQVKTMRLEHDVECQVCDDKMFECDERLIDTVICLNKKGYQTIYCCEGHHQDVDPQKLYIGEVMNVPYITLLCKPDQINMIIKLSKSNKFPHINTEVITKNDSYHYYTWKYGLYAIHISSVDMEKFEHADTYEVDEFLQNQIEFNLFLKELVEQLPDIGPRPIDLESEEEEQ